MSITSKSLLNVTKQGNIFTAVHAHNSFTGTDQKITVTKCWLWITYVKQI